MSGHGHVTPNPDGSKARCGGPSICSKCSAEFARLKLQGATEAVNVAYLATSLAEREDGHIEMAERGLFDG